MDFIQIGNLRVSRVILGSNPFGGFSHQGPGRDDEMLHYYSAARIKEVLRQAERLGINTIMARADQHMIRLLMEYRDEGGCLQWIAQTCPELGTIEQGIHKALPWGARGCYIHGGVMDFLYANNKLEAVPAALAKIRRAGIPAGIAAHNPKVLAWAEDNLDVDFYMCSYYNPIPREENPAHVSGSEERYNSGDRDIMAAAIRGLKKPAIHYKVMAAGRDDPEEALAFTARNMRPGDGVCIGIFAKDNLSMLEEDVALLYRYLRAQK